MTIAYTVNINDSGAHLYTLTCELDVDGPITVAMPAWIPGSYMIRDFAKNVVALAVSCDKSPALVSRLNKDAWAIECDAGRVVLRYQVYAWDLSVRTAHLDSTHGYFNGSSLFLRVAGREDESCSVTLRPISDWEVATTLRAKTIDSRGFGVYQCENYSDLIDHPVEMGRFDRVSFEAGGIPHELVLSGRHSADLSRLQHDLKTICEYEIGLFGAPAPFHRYLFLTWVVGEGYGGLEHRSSTSLLCSRGDLPTVNDSAMTDAYRGFLGLCSHEYFHSWNVKRIRPAELAESDLSREVYTRQLWIFEGITSYYDDLTLVRCGLIDAKSYLELLAKNITRLMRGAGRLKQSVSDSSFDAWTKFYKQDENAPNAIVSYYTKGAVIALLLDLTIRAGTDGSKSLDDIMRTLWARFGQTDTPVQEGDVEQLAQEVSGIDLTSFFDAAIRSTDELPIAEMLALFGIGMSLQSARSAKDQGGVCDLGDASVKSLRTWLGARVVQEGREVKVSHVFDDGPAQIEGLSSGDRIIAVDGLKCSAGDIDKLLMTAIEGQSLHLHVFRRDELMEFDLKLQSAPDDTCYLSLLEDIDDKVIQQRQYWLKG